MLRLDSEDVGKESMITEIGADGRVVDDRLDVESLEVIAVSDSRKHEDLGRVYSSC